MPCSTTWLTSTSLEGLLFNALAPRCLWMKKPVAGVTCHGPRPVPNNHPRRQSRKATFFSALACIVSVQLPTRSPGQSGGGDVCHVALDLALIRTVGHKLAHDPVCVERRDAVVQAEHGVSIMSGRSRATGRTPGLGVHVEQVVEG